MKFVDLFKKVGIENIQVKDEYLISENGIDFNKVSEPIEDINDCIVVFEADYSDNDKLTLFITNVSCFVRASAYNYKNHKEIINRITKIYFKTYKLIDSYYNALADEEKLKLELEN